jgi:hypothetical protein
LAKFIPNFLYRRAGVAVVAQFCLLLSMGLPMAAAQSAPPDFVIHTATVRLANGALLRTFAGRAAPPAVLRDPRTGQDVNIYQYFPNPNDPFAIDSSRQLGVGGFGLQTIDRALTGVIPSPGDAPWALNMIPFGVALDGSLIDPSGPWYDGGPADPKNPFDRNCTGWEYEVLSPTVRRLVGVPDVVPGHVQPGGLFHYHGYPDLLIANLRVRERAMAAPSRTTVAGFSGDGYPIIDYVIGAQAPGGPPSLFLFSGYVLRDGGRAAQDRTNPAYTPSGNHDGLYVEDHVFDPNRKATQIDAALARSGEYHGLKADDLRAGRASYALLDPLNGIVLRGPNQVLGGYPPAHYAYVLTPDWPETPRLFAFEPDESFKRIIPFQRMLRRGRKALYDNCSSELSSIHVWGQRAPY